MKKAILNTQLNIFSNTELAFLLISDSVLPLNAVTGAAILNSRWPPYTEFSGLSSTLKMLRTTLIRTVPNFVLLSKSALLFHKSAQLY